ncbi:hypothetical protein Cni_G17324 [Canna indica]|uniref:Uncharacterized protein n=1 Tax=Canna indica TaxID=4628 RepID=A0AAQ3QDG3_9LILI|nr:hypothetical protein Cni_G17324 [Canna indica]
MKRRRVRAVLVGCLILVLLFSLHGFSRNSTHYHHQLQKEGSESTPTSVGRRGCKLKKINLCDYFTQAEKNQSLIVDNKRLVPTGPNPLHNR